MKKILTVSLVLILVLGLVGCSGDNNDLAEDEAYGLKVEFDIPNELLNEASIETIEENIQIEKAEVELYLGDDEIDSKTVEDISENNEIPFSNLEAGEQYEIKVELIGCIRDEDEEKVLYKGEEVSQKIEADSITPVSLEVDLLDAQSLKVNIESDIEIEEIKLHKGDDWVVKDYDNEIITFKANKLDFDLTPAWWDISIKEDGGDFSDEKEVLLLPTEEKEITLNIDKDDETGEIEIEIITHTSPDEPTGLELNDEDNLVWDEYDNADYYKIYKTETDTFNNDEFITVKDNIYEDLKKGYHYWIRVYDVDGYSSGLSEVFYFEDEVLEIEDENLESALRDEVDKSDGDLYADDFKDLKRLFLYDSNISDISSLADANLSNLRELILGQNNISDISPLEEANFDNLYSLDLSYNNISDISLLKEAKLENLETLSLSYDDMSDIISLTDTNFENLKNLHLGGNNMSDISAIVDANFENLESLNLYDNNISDISPLTDANLKNLKILRLFKTDISDISPLIDSNFDNLSSLLLAENEISDISPLVDADFENLHELALVGSNISDISPLVDANIENLSFLGLGENSISDISPLADINFNNLNELTLGYNKISDIAPLTNVNFQDGTWLFLSGNEISDLSPMVNGDFNNLSSLLLAENEISDISPLANVSFDNLSRLDLKENNISDLDEYKEEIGDGNINISY